MTATKQDFHLWLGDDCVVEIYVTNELSGLAQNLAGAAITWELYDRRTTVLVKSTATGTITVPDPASGYFYVNIAAADTALFDPGDFGHEAEVTLAGKKSTVTVGTVTLHPDRSLNLPPAP